MNDADKIKEICDIIINTGKQNPKEGTWDINLNDANKLYQLDSDLANFIINKRNTFSLFGITIYGIGKIICFNDLTITYYSPGLGWSRL